MIEANCENHFDVWRNQIGTWKFKIKIFERKHCVNRRRKNLILIDFSWSFCVFLIYFGFLKFSTALSFRKTGKICLRKLKKSVKGRKVNSKWRIVQWAYNKTCKFSENSDTLVQPNDLQSSLKIDDWKVDSREFHLLDSLQKIVYQNERGNFTFTKNHQKKNQIEFEKSFNKMFFRLTLRSLKTAL